MKLNSFIKKYDAFETDEERAEFLKSHIKRTYVPFMEKNTMAERAAKVSCVFDDKYDKHSSIFDMFQKLDMFEAYTDIEFDRVKDGQVFTDKVYDALQMREIFDKLEISEKERDEFDMVYYQALMDLGAKYTSQYAMNEKMAERISDVFNVISEQAKQVLQQAADAGVINQVIKELQTNN